MSWITTKDGRHVNTDWFEKDKQIANNTKEADERNKKENVAISKHSGDTITEQAALDKWAKNPSGIRAASQGEKYERKIGEKVGINDEARAEVISKWVKGSSTDSTIYRGLSNLSDEDYKRYTTVGNEVSEKGLTSWSTDKGVSTGYGQYGNSITFVKQGSKDARSLGNITGTNTEKEVIVLNAKSKIDKVVKDKYTTYVYLK